MRNIHLIMTAFDQFQFERHLHQQHQYMQHADKRQKANEIIRNHLGFAMGAALVPFPGADLLAVSAVQLNMLRQLAKLYQISFVDSLGKNFISAVVGTGAARVGASLIKLIPGVGTVIGDLSMTALSGASTYALGNVVANHFHNGGTLEDLDIAQARKRYQDSVDEGKEVVKDLKNEEKAVSEVVDGPLEKIKKLAEMRDVGILTEEEFAEMKGRLLKEV